MNFFYRLPVSLIAYLMFGDPKSENEKLAKNITNRKVVFGGCLQIGSIWDIAGHKIGSGVPRNHSL